MPRILGNRTNNRLEPDYSDAFQAWQKEPGPQSTSKLLKTVDPVLQTAVRTYGGPKPSPTLRTRAKVLASDAFKTYDPQRGSLRNHLLSNLQRLQRYSTSERQIVRTPEAVGLQRQHLNRAEHQLSENLGRSPTMAELADETGLSRKRIQSLKEAVTAVPEGTTARTSMEGDFYQPAGKLVTQQHPPWLSFAYDDMAPVDQYITERALGLYGHKQESATQIAQGLGISPAAVSKRMTKIQEQLDEWEDTRAGS